MDEKINNQENSVYEDEKINAQAVQNLEGNEHNDFSVSEKNTIQNEVETTPKTDTTSESITETVVNSEVPAEEIQKTANKITQNDKITQIDNINQNDDETQSNKTTEVDNNTQSENISENEVEIQSEDDIRNEKYQDSEIEEDYQEYIREVEKILAEKDPKENVQKKKSSFTIFFENLNYRLSYTPALGVVGVLTIVCLLGFAFFLNERNIYISDENMANSCFVLEMFFLIVGLIFAILFISSVILNIIRRKKGKR